MKRYNDPETKSLIKDVTLRTIAEQIPMCIGASAADTAVRSMIKLMMATCRWVEVRQKAMSHMECKNYYFYRHRSFFFFFDNEFQLLFLCSIFQT